MPDKNIIMPKDGIYKKQQTPVPPFEFNETVVQVFDDMLKRSIPGYQEIIRQQARLTLKYYQPGTRIYDLGCSNGNFGINLLDIMPSEKFEMIAVDNSPPMLNQYRQRLSAHPKGKKIQLECKNIQDVQMKNASVIIVNFTLQFLPPQTRDQLIRDVFSALQPQGILLISEKVIHQDDQFSALQQEFYYRFKKENGYSEMEISRKREALENVLIPETIETHLQRLGDTGFIRTDIWHKWFNFTALIAQK